MPKGPLKGLLEKLKGEGIYKGIKFLLISLGVVSFFIVGIAMWIYSSNQAKVIEYTKKQAELENQSAQLQEKLGVSQKQVQTWQEKSESITTALNSLSKEHALLQTQYEALVKEKDSLLEQNQNLKAELERLDKLYAEAQEKAKLKPKKVTDEFLATLLEEKAALELEIENLKGKIDSQETQLERIQEDIEPAQESFVQLEREREALEKSLVDAQRVSDILSKDLLQERKRVSALEKELNKTENQLLSITEERDRLSEQVMRMKQVLERRLLELGETEKEIESAVEDAKEVAKEYESSSIELPPIIVKADASVTEVQSLAEPLEKKSSRKLERTRPLASTKLTRERGIREQTFELVGRIITVNDKYRFVVIDIGQEDGVEKGMMFDVYRRGERVGRVDVIETRKKIAACNISEVVVKRLAVNDIVRR